MSWLNVFELLCYVLTAMLIVALVRKKDYSSIFLFGSAALVGFFMELAAVKATGIYHYNPDFWFSLGFEPNQFPFFGGLMWGGLTVCAIGPASKLGGNRLFTGLAAGMLIVTMDIFLDVAAIRLDGGFWVWEGREVSFAINQHTFMSVIWVNFLGYMFETPTVVLLKLKERETEASDAAAAKNKAVRQWKWMFLIAIGAILVTAAGSLISLGLNALTDDWFAAIVFPVLWVILIVMMVRRAVKAKIRIHKPSGMDIVVALFWAAMYLYCLIALFHLGVGSVYPWYMAAGIILMLGTAYLSLAEPTID